MVNLSVDHQVTAGFSLLVMTWFLFHGTHEHVLSVEDQFTGRCSVDILKVGYRGLLSIALLSIIIFLVSICVVLIKQSDSFFPLSSWEMKTCRWARLFSMISLVLQQSRGLVIASTVEGLYWFPIQSPLQRTVVIPVWQAIARNRQCSYSLVMLVRRWRVLWRYIDKITVKRKFSMIK